MAALTDLSDVVNRYTGGNDGTPEPLHFMMTGRTAGAAVTGVSGARMSLWRTDGNPSGGAVPTSVEAPTVATAGSLGQTNPGGSRQKWLTSLFAVGSSSGLLVLYDRLLHIGGLSGTVATAQTVGGSLTRYTDGAGVFAMAEIYTQIGTTATTITMNYTDQDGNSGITSPAVAIGGTGNREAQRAIMLPVAVGDSGVQAVASATLAATTGTAGNFGVTLGKVIARVPIGPGSPGVRDFILGLPGIPEIQPDACLSWLWVSAGTGIPEVIGGAMFVEK